MRNQVKYVSQKRPFSRQKRDMDKRLRSDFNVEALADEFLKRLIDKNFESIYRDSNSGLRLSISEEKFVSKLKTIYSFMVKADSELNWRPNPIFTVPSGELGVYKNCYYAQKIYFQNGESFEYCALLC
jgi:hypothetical protein